MRWAARLALFAGAAILASAPALATDTCAPDSDLDYVCGAQKPEDVLAFDDGRWIVASGFAEGAGLKLVDRATRHLDPWYRGTADQIAFDRAAFPQCPGPVDPELFDARGLSLRPQGAGRWRLLVVNHGGRQSIEAFDVALTAGRPHLAWRGCLPMPEGQVGNAVSSFSDGTVIVTVLTRPGTTIGDFMLGKPTGGVWQWRRGDTHFSLLPGTELPGNNGLDVDPDDRHFYVVAFGWHAVLVYDRASTEAPVERVDAPDFLPDNIHWSGTHLLLAGMRLDEPACGGLRKVEKGVADPMLCHRGWVVGEFDRAHHRIATVAYGRPQPAFNGLSAATIAGEDLWLGSFQADRLAIVRDWRRTDVEQK